ncbi:Intradiol ring-cleavage dioxygenase [Flagelloscypha sp. PMI_526]|nr:Intradiol ring-cleavage dioxygenase [Flagelloscypha sp. PMI_526]
MRFLFLALLPLVLGHVEDFSAEAVARRNEFQIANRRALLECRDHFHKREVGIAQRAVERRQDLLSKARRLAGISNEKRSLTDVLNKNHKTNHTGVTPNTDPSTFITPTCVLGQEGEVGPFYVNGELIQTDLRAGQAGVDVYLDFQVIDVSTCNPVSGLYIDLWGANATGHYSAVAADGGTANLKTNHGRGIQLTDSDGVVQYLSHFPGHYSGRTNHLHIIANSNGTLFSNGTFKASTVKHHTQLFWDQSLITQVEALSPYSGNTTPLTTNAVDRVLAGEAATFDPVLEYTFVGSNAASGIIAWISIGINVNQAETVSAASTWTANGAVTNSGGGGPPGKK